MLNSHCNKTLLVNPIKNPETDAFMKRRTWDNVFTLRRPLI